MKLKDWLAREDISIDEFSKSIKVARRTVYGWLNEGRVPLREAARKVERATKGQVTAAEMRGINK